jgi:transcriptional regulator
MYIPQYNLVTDQSEIVAFMKRYNFAAIITTSNNEIIASHLPFVIEEENGKIILYAHYAKSNLQWKHVMENRLLVIFAEPHAYISPKYYEHEINVPTWNYAAVHAYGKTELIESNKGIIDILERSMDFFEPVYKEQWKNLPEDYKQRLLKGVVGIKIYVTELQAKKKLSQNRTENERQNIIESFSRSNNTNEKEIAELMKNNKSTNL